VRTNREKVTDRYKGLSCIDKEDSLKGNTESPGDSTQFWYCIPLFVSLDSVTRLYVCVLDTSTVIASRLEPPWIMEVSTNCIQ